MRESDESLFFFFGSEKKGYVALKDSTFLRLYPESARDGSTENKAAPDKSRVFTFRSGLDRSGALWHIRNAGPLRGPASVSGATGDAYELA